MTVWYIDIMWALMLFGIALFTGCLLVLHPVLREVRLMGMVTAYGFGLWMFLVLEWRVAVVTWCVFAAFGGVVAFLYELWARYHYRGRDRRARPLVLLRGLLLWPTMVPEAIEGMLIDAGVLEPSAQSPASARSATD